MDSDELDTLWRSQEQTAPINIDPDMLMREVRRNEHYFKAMVFWRDVREIGVALIMSAFFIYGSVKYSIVSWSLYIVALSCIWIAAFMFVDRIRHKRSLKLYDQSLIGNTQRALEQVNHQIWLLKNVLWWYLLPPGLAIALFIGHVVWLTGFVMYIWWIPLYCVLGIILYVGIYWLNQYAVRTELRPRQSELQALLDKLTSNRE